MRSRVGARNAGSDSSPGLTLLQQEEYTFPLEITGARFVVEWESTNAEIICDLDLVLYLYDEKAKFVQKLDLDSPKADDGAVELESDIASSTSRPNKSRSEENFYVKLSGLDRRISSVLVFIDGGSKNFQYAKNLSIRCMREDVSDDNRDGNLMRYLVSNGMQGYERRSTCPLFTVNLPCFMDGQCFIGIVLYRAKWVRDVSGSEQCEWVCNAVIEPLRATSLQDKQSLCHRRVVSAVPSLQKYCPRIFPTISSICSSLSSNSLPDLKNVFLENDGLPRAQFTSTLFSALYVVKPKIVDPFEASYTVAMLDELFCQIDFNGDGVVDWEEFTTFCIFMGLQQLADAEKPDITDDAVRYVEDTSRREHRVLTHTALVSSITHDKITKRMFVIQKKAAGVDIIDEYFNKVAFLDPMLLLPECSRKSKSLQSIKVYSVCYIPGRDLYVYSASDYSIVFCKEIFACGGEATFAVHRRIIHAFLHFKLCWCEYSKTLCSVSLDSVIYGWSVDSHDPLFEVSRHSDTITDIVALDGHGLVATCSLDKKIIVWSQRTQRVKGVFQGHNRGIKVISALGDCLLSAGFECDAKTWDLVSMEPLLTLRGHRMPITTARMMTAMPDCQRAATVDESGEFRIWDVMVKGGFDTGQFATTINVFSIHTNSPLARIVFLAFPFESEYSIGKHSNIIACSSSLTHFTPESKVTEFIPPSGMCYSEANGCVITSIGKTLHKYDMFTGKFQSTYEDLHDGEVTCFQVDKDGRRIFVGNSAGEVLLVNFMSGQLVQVLNAHLKEVMCLNILRTHDVEMLYTGSNDGQLRLFNMNSGVLTLHQCNDHALPEGSAVTNILPFLDFQVILVTSLSRSWGLFHAKTLRRLRLVHEANVISGLALIGGGGVEEHCCETDVHNQEINPGIEVKQIVTFALAISTEILVLSVDLVNFEHVTSHKLSLVSHAFLSNIVCLKYPENSVNYTRSESADSLASLVSTLIATSDEGMIYVWDISHVRLDSLKIFDETFKHIRLPSKLSGAQEVGNKKESPLFSSLFLTDADCESAVNNDVLPIEPVYSWKGHNDVIINLAALTEHGCFVTNSLDGYHHLWNLEKVRLGFFSLPNLHVKLKKDPSESNAWKFAMEKIHVSKSQEEAASIIVTNISRKEKHQLFRISSTSAARRNGLKKLRTKKTFSDIRKLQLSTSQDKVNTTAGVTTDSNFSTRNVLLKSLSDTCNVENSSPNGNQPYSSDNLATAVSYSSPNKKSSPVSVIQPSEDIFSPVKTSDDDKDKLLSASTADGISAHQPVHSSSLITKVTSSGRGSGCLIAAKEKDSALMWTKATDLSHRRAGAFTETSISSSVHAGFIGAEECKILRNTCKDKEKLRVYARSQPTLFLKNPRMNTSAVFPSLDSIDKSELKFGTQTGMYKHANKHLARKGLTYVQKNGAQHSICRSRISSNLRRVGSMIKEVSVKAHEIELDTVGMQLSSPPLHPPVPVESRLDTKRVEDLMDKVAQAEVEAVPPWETRAALSKKDMLASKRFKKHNSSFKKSHVKLTAATLESKVYKAIKVYFNNQDRGWSSDKLTTSVIDDNNVAAIDVKRLPTLTARDLLPSYKMADVTNFLRIFHDIDTNYTGVLDASEWIMFFTTLNSQVDQHYAKLMFYQIDSNGDGVLSIHELLPVVFPKANRDKLNLIEEYMDHAIESQKLHMSHSLKLTDLQCLFEHYDTTMIGFIKVGFIRQQITALQLPRIAHDEIMFSLKNIENDEMYSEQEFIRIFKPYTEK